MSTPRRPLGPISGNRIKKTELSPYLRGQLIGARIMGSTPAQIADAFKLHDSTVRTTILRASERDNGLSKPRIGPPRCMTDRDERFLIRHIRLHPKDTFAQVKEATQLNISTSTIKNVCRKYQISHWRAKRRPALTEKAVKARFAWAKAHKDWTVEQWANWMWSDECSAERGQGKRGVWVFGTPVQKWDPQLVSTYHKGKDISVMVWGCFWSKNGVIGRSDLYILDRDFEAKKHGYSARSYLEVLDDQLHRCWEPGLVFMQDNASIHTAKVVKDWFIEHGIPVEGWPPYSPDMNPIEHVWYPLKKYVLDHYPELLSMGAGEDAIAALGRALVEAWNALPDTLFTALINSMPDRVDALYKAKGWHTKY